MVIINIILSGSGEQNPLVITPSYLPKDFGHIREVPLRESERERNCFIQSSSDKGLATLVKVVITRGTTNY